jgi:hypothetical protein
MAKPMFGKGVGHQEESASLIGLLGFQGTPRKRIDREIV